jgi:hypothetical protein
VGMTWVRCVLRVRRACGWPGGARSAWRGHGALDTWGVKTGQGWRCGARGGVHSARTSRLRPGSACGPSEPQRGRRALERHEPEPIQPNPL